jgi:sugar fermentation stimulation protein A
VQREDCESFQIAKDIDSKYHQGFLSAKKNGVKFISYSCKVSEKEIYVNQPIKIIFK